MTIPQPPPAAAQGLVMLIYASSALKPLTSDELVAILKKAREKNARLDITGMLLYKNGNFLQALEGPEQAVMDLYKTIQQDARHYQVATILKRPIQKRDFSEWEMGFVDLGKPELKEVPGYTAFLKEPFTIERFNENPSIAYEFLQAFKEGMR